MTLSSLLCEGEYVSSYDPAQIEVQGICVHLPSLTPGCLFLCLRGMHYDTHAMLAAVARGGAAAAIVEEGAVYKAPPGLPLFIVPQARRMYALLYDRYCGHPARDMTLIAVTGTNGKTSTATMLYTILREAGIACALIGTVTCQAGETSYALPPEESDGRRTMTTPDPDILYPMLARMRQDGITHVVMEASSHALALDKLVPLHFACGIFTNLSPEHLDLHGTMENYLAAKARLFSMCDYGIINFDSEYAEALVRGARCRILRCGAVYHEQYNAEEIARYGARGIGYVYHSPTLRMALSLPIPGVFTVYNSLLALTCALQLGVEPVTARHALQHMRGVPGRLERVVLDPALADFHVFIDYAHTEAALRSLLTTVRTFRQGGERIVLLFGCGGDRDKSKRPLMGRVAEEYADLVIVTSDNSRTENPTSIIRDIVSGMRHKERRRVIVDRRAAITYAVQQAQKNDILLLVGKGHETYELRNGQTHPFDERAIVQKALAHRRETKEHYADPS